MTPPKYKQGKKIHSVGDFERSSCFFFKVQFGNRFKTIHRSFLISWQYRTLKRFIDNGWVYEANEIE